MKKLRMGMILSVALVLMLSGCGNTSSERCNGTSDITITAMYERENVGKSQLTGSLFNNSLEKDYKDIQVRINFFDTAGSKISSQIMEVDERIKRGEAEKFRFDFNSPVGTKHTSWEVLCAVNS